jgi:histone-lysine N-methyltransferase SUV39H
MPYIAFVAAEDIPTRTEFTIDYNPRAAAVEEAARLKKKGKPAVKRPQGAEDCFCNSRGCRGFI